MKHTATGPVDIYAVGLLADLRDFVHNPDRDEARRHLRYALRRPARYIRTRKWRELRKYLNGYIAEPRDWPAGLIRCGTGWTRGRAYRDLKSRTAATLIATGTERATR